MANILITGGCGFIGANFVELLEQKGDNIFVLDSLTYAANKHHIAHVPHKFFKAEIGNEDFIRHILNEYKIDKVVNFAAESHVDNSIKDPYTFIDTNITQTAHLLNVCLEYQKTRDNFRFLHVSTDEVFGDLEINDPKFTEKTPYNPSSPYSASKAASDHLVKAWVRTYKLNGVLTNCTNNFGKYQHKEKLVPKVISLCMENKPITIYGTGTNIRDWIYVEDHCEGIYLALNKGQIGESYGFGGNTELTNLDIVHQICEIMDELHPRDKSYKENIIFVKDRAGHDLRYALDDSKSQTELGYSRQGDFRTNLKTTIEYYLGL
jgi:dTDP-glucose 4,6-dehydratase